MNETISQREQIDADVLSIAIEGGCNYWAGVSAYKHSVMPAFATIFELGNSGEESLGEITVTSDDIGKVIRIIEGLIRAGESGNPIRFLGLDTIKSVRAALLNPDDADYDADAADQILQLAFFGLAKGGITLENMEIVYG